MSKSLEQSAGEFFAALVSLAKADPAHEVSRSAKALIEAACDTSDPAYKMVPLEFKIAIPGFLKMLKMLKMNFPK